MTNWFSSMPPRTTLPARSTATQSATVGHDTDETVVVPSTTADVQVPAAVPVGLVEVTASPLPSATHIDADGHEIASRSPTSAATFHADGPPVGDVELTMSPLASTPTHCVADEHEMAVMAYPFGSAVAVDHCPAPPLGFVAEAMTP